MTESQKQPPPESTGSPTEAATTAPRMRRGEFLRLMQSILWVAIYLLLVVFPLILLLLGSVPKGGGFWWDFAMAMGFAGLAMLGLQFVLTARFRRLTAPFGIDIIYFFHRWAAIGATGLVLVHYAILRLKYSEVLGSANPLSAPWQMTAGRVALLIFVVIVISSLWRKQFRIHYDQWRLTHGVLAVMAVGLAVAHIQGVGHYTRTPAKQFFWSAYTVLWLLVLGYIRVVKPWLLLRKPYRVADVRPERGDSWTVTVEPEGAHRLKFKPGQFAWLTLGCSPFRAREHPFSFSGSAENDRQLQFTIKELGDFTRTIRNFKPGDRAYVDGPHGVFTTDHAPGAPGFVLIAGGVGIAPIISILRTLADRGESRPIILIYGNSGWDRVLFREELESLQNRLRLQVVHVLEKPPENWSGERGMITAELLQKQIDSHALGFTCFVCGPAAMTRAVQQSLREMGVPLHRIHFERFEMV